MTGLGTTETTTVTEEVVIEEAVIEEAGTEGTETDTAGEGETKGATEEIPERGTADEAGGISTTGVTMSVQGETFAVAVVDAMTTVAIARLVATVKTWALLLETDEGADVTEKMEPVQSAGRLHLRVLFLYHNAGVKHLGGTSTHLVTSSTQLSRLNRQVGSKQSFDCLLLTSAFSRALQPSRSESHTGTTHSGDLRSSSSYASTRPRHGHGQQPQPVPSISTVVHRQYHS